MSNKVIFSNYAICGALQTVFKAMESKPTVPIIESFKIEISGQTNRATISATDLSNFLQTTIKCEADHDFSFLIDREILKVLKKLDNQPIVFEVKEIEGGKNEVFEINISGESDKFKYYSSAADMFPGLPSVEYSFVAGFNTYNNEPDLLTEIKTLDKY